MSDYIASLEAVLNVVRCGSFPTWEVAGRLKLDHDNRARGIPDTEADLPEDFHCFWIQDRYVEKGKLISAYSKVLKGAGAELVSTIDRERLMRRVAGVERAISSCLDMPDTYDPFLYPPPPSGLEGSLMDCWLWEKSKPRVWPVEKVKEVFTAITLRLDSLGHELLWNPVGFDRLMDELDKSDPDPGMVEAYVIREKARMACLEWLDGKERREFLLRLLGDLKNK